MSSQKKQYFLDKIVDGKMSAADARRLEANKIMNFGDKEPSHLTTSNTLYVSLNVEN